MMALINNWDLKDVNNAVYDQERRAPIYRRQRSRRDRLVTTGRAALARVRKGNLGAYEASTFISSRKPTAKRTSVPLHCTTLLYAIASPQFINRINLEWIGRHIPDDDARWMAGTTRPALQPEQIARRIPRRRLRSAICERVPDVVECVQSPRHRNKDPLSSRSADSQTGFRRAQHTLRPPQISSS